MRNQYHKTFKFYFIFFYMNTCFFSERDFKYVQTYQFVNYSPLTIHCVKKFPFTKMWPVLVIFTFTCDKLCDELLVTARTNIHI